MTRDLWIVYHPAHGPLTTILADSKETAWMALYANKIAPSPLSDAHIAAMSAYASDHKAAQEWLKAMGYTVIPAKLKYDEVKP